MVVLSLSSKRFNCRLELKEKVTFVVGNSATGKTEMVRRLSSDSSSKHVDVSNGFSYEVLTSKRFHDSCNNALRHILYERGLDLVSFNSLDEKTRRSYYCSYWRDSLNFPFSNSIIIIDDEDFVDSMEFQAFFDCDCSNYYVIINRLHLSRIGYSVSEVYNYKVDGTNHYLEKRYTPSSTLEGDFDFIVTEGVGSDYIFFKSWFGERVINPTFSGKLKSGGRTNVVKMITMNKETFRNKHILVLIDYVAFGANFASLISVCKEISANLCVISSYESFEYMLLRSNIVSDNSLGEYVNANRLKFSSLEVLYTHRLGELTKGTLLSYKKKADDFPVCYYEDCCLNVSYRNNSCDLRIKFYKKDKFTALLKNTEFSDLIRLRDNRHHTNLNKLETF